MNWGTKLMIGMATFMCFIVALGITMFNSKSDALVDNDYYEKGINYDEEYNSKEQVKKDSATPTIEITEAELTLKFISSAVGDIRLMRLDDKNMDKSFHFESTADHRVAIPMDALAKGRWNLRIRWTSHGNQYVDEQAIHLK